MHHENCFYCRHPANQHYHSYGCAGCDAGCKIYIGDWRPIRPPRDKCTVDGCNNAGKACARCGGGACDSHMSSAAWDTFGVLLCNSCNGEADAEWQRKYSYYSRYRSFEPLPASPYYGLRGKELCGCNNCEEERRPGFFKRLFGQ